jgi:uncharacterized protein YkwD
MKLFFLLLPVLCMLHKTDTCNNKTSATKLSGIPLVVATDISADSAIQQILHYTNIERQKAKLPPLTINNKLMNAAADYAKLMAQEDDLSHTVNGHTLPARYAVINYIWKYCGENIASNMILNGESTVEDQWMQSSGHKANILNANFTEIGIGIAYSSQSGRYYYCQDFGQPR